MWRPGNSGHAQVTALNSTKRGYIGDCIGDDYRGS